MKAALLLTWSLSRDFQIAADEPMMSVQSWSILVHCGRDNPTNSQHGSPSHDSRCHVVLLHHLLPHVEWGKLRGKRASREEND